MIESFEETLWGTKKKKNHNQNKTNKQTINQDKYVKSLFLNTLRCIYLSTKTNDTKHH